MPISLCPCKAQMHSSHYTSLLKRQAPDSSIAVPQIPAIPDSSGSPRALRYVSPANYLVFSAISSPFEGVLLCLVCKHSPLEMNSARSYVQIFANVVFLNNTHFTNSSEIQVQTRLVVVSQSLIYTTGKWSVPETRAGIRHL